MPTGPRLLVSWQKPPKLLYNTGPQASRPLAMPSQKTKQQQQLNQDYASFLIEHESAKAQGEALGTFLEWRHKNDKDGIKILDRKR